MREKPKVMGRIEGRRGERGEWEEGEKWGREGEKRSGEG